MINIAGTSLLQISLICLVLVACSDEEPVDTQPLKRQDEAISSEATFVGSAQCALCHKEEAGAWQGSHHQLAMQAANSDSVLGDFSGVAFEYQGQKSHFYQKEGRYYVRTDGPNGDLQDYPLAYTFGVHPLQQYLIDLGGGHFQALSIAWDSRDKSAGGQRWFHLYPDQAIDHQHPLHWTGINQNWNFMCSDCHSTNLQKAYNLQTDSYQTSWSEISVGCESCHGPGSRHLQWAKTQNETLQNKGLAPHLIDPTQQLREMDLQTGIAKLAPSAAIQREITTCAQCHSRRSTHLPGAQANSELLDHFNLTLLQEPLYHADGQADGEVFVYGSFLQSKMYAAGVTCGHCHNPHSLQLRTAGDAVCAQCHMPARFARTDHHLHPTQSPGARCTNCHMPEKNFMQVDGRRDHSFRVPRPDLSKALGTPNTCNSCHQDKSSQWAAKILEDKYGSPPPHYGQTLHAAMRGDSEADKMLMDLIQDSSQPEIVRASAIRLLPRYLTINSAQLLQQIAQGEEPLLNLALAQSLDELPEQLRLMIGVPLLFSKMAVTRSLAANGVTDAQIGTMPAQVQQQYSKALKTYTTSELFNSDRPESLVNLGNLHFRRGNTQQAEAFYRRAITKASYYTPAYINLADLYRASGRETDAELLLRGALSKSEDIAVIQHALGLSLVRQNRHQEAMGFLKAAAEHEQTQSRYLYVYAIAVHSEGNSELALDILEDGYHQFPQDLDILRALISISRESGKREIAQKYEALLASKR
ncbi:tetratricopeptide repeat protein [Microbulbifer sp. VAAF005]|uniref:tetratricopeptide repeat protein n=1 Tax=Microbulbifer sp. VAAF005 TaxID=3034230 RepID=UPI0024ACFB09|nr:tetratricopeptide repeat protein [Microbulbifer sp. VAAF005]WHI47565.1 tetratricopeptide repeat protein [Microbulbifer sp. VAAF005]